MKPGVASYSYCILPVLLATFLISTSTSIYSHNDSFSVELIHRDSPKSPFYNTQKSPQKWTNMLRRSLNRVYHFYPSDSLFNKDAQSEVIANHGEYVMSISIGTPPFPILGIADTGSDLIWTQCKPCTKCFKQNAPPFDPSSSITYRELSCHSHRCQMLNELSSCPIDVNYSCKYLYSYGDNSFTIGNLAADTITLDAINCRGHVSLHRATFGCGHNNNGSFNGMGSGAIGLGRGSLSLVSQLGYSIGGKFSYCLVPFDSKSANSSRINFGRKAVISGEGVQSTPLISKAPNTFYSVTLEAFTVGSKRIKFPGSSSEAMDGNIIMDTGTTLTMLPKDFYLELESAVGDMVSRKRVNDPQGILSLCYHAKPDDLDIPAITAHFTGADVKLRPINTFIEVVDGVMCFAFSSSSIYSGAIFGNLAQMNYMVAYDLHEKIVSFKHTGCAEQGRVDM